MNIGEKIKELRIENQLTQKQLAEKLKISQSSVCEWERNQYEPTATAIKLLSSFFEVDSDYLLGIEKEKSYGRQKNNNLKPQEQELLSMFAFLDEDEKGKILDDCKYFYNKHVNKNQSQRRA